ncbi:MAG: transposase [Serratia symbiotica]|nr:transposase [Serratia symbiotica]
MLVTRRCSASGQAVDTGCWAHVLRAVHCQPKPGGEASSDTIYELYRLERKIKHRSADKNVNGDSAMPTPGWTAFHQWLLLNKRRRPPTPGYAKRWTIP